MQQNTKERETNQKMLCKPTAKLHIIIITIKKKALNKIESPGAARCGVNSCSQTSAR